MSQTQHKRPDAKGVELPQEKLARQKLEATLDHRTKEAQRALEKAQGGGEIDAEVAAQLQRGMGNAAVSTMVKQGSDTDTATTEAEATLDEARAEEEDQEQEETEAGEVDHVLPSFSTGGGGGGGGGGTSPWDVGKYFGGDGDADEDPADTLGARWRPMPVPPDLDEDLDLESVEADDEGGAGPAGAEDDDDELGSAPWSPGCLSRGLRDPSRLRGTGVSDTHGAVDAVWARARSMLIFLGQHAPDAERRWLARVGSALGTGEVPRSLAVARELAFAEAVLDGLPAGWAAVCDVAADQRARPRAEAAAAVLAPDGKLYAPALLAQALGEVTARLDAEPAEEAHPAALAAVERAARPAELPGISLWSPPPGDASADADPLDRLLDAALGVEPRGDEFPAALTPVYDQLNALLSALGEVQVEGAAAALAAWPWLPDGVAEGLAHWLDTALRGLGRRLVEAGRSVEAAAETRDLAAIDAAVARARAVAVATPFVRRAALVGLAARLMPPDRGGAPSPPPPDPVEELLAAGRTAEARAAVNGDRGLRGAAVRLLMDGPRALLAPDPTLPALLVVAAHESAESSAPLPVAPVGGGPFALAYFALFAAWRARRAGRADSARAVLRDAAAQLQAAGEGAALNLVKAGWRLDARPEV